MKKLVALLAALLALGLASAAQAAGPSMGSIHLPAQATPATLMTGTSFTVNTSPVINSDAWQGNLDNAEAYFYFDRNSPYSSCVWNPNYQDYDCPTGPLEVYTIACWTITVDVVGPGYSWDCTAYHSNPFGPHASENAVAAQFTIGSLGTTGYDLCSWLGAFNPLDDTCNAVGSSYTAGSASPLQSGNLMPNLDPYVGKTVNIIAGENWCTALAPPGFDITANNGYVSGTPAPGTLPVYNGCAGSSTDAIPVGLTARLLASTNGSGPPNDGPPVVQKVTTTIAPGPNDCIVPRVKGLRLHQARLRLFAHHCRANISYGKGKRVGRVRYQTLPVGTPRPHAFRVKLVVVRRKS